MALVEAAGVSHEYRRGATVLRAVDGVSLRVDAGEFVALVGPSGSGKSTLLHILGGVLRPTSGAVTIEDRVLAGLSDDALTDIRRRRVGLVFQFFALLPALSAWENVAVPGLLEGTALRRSRTRAMQLLELVGLADRAEHRPAQLSGGELQRVAIARALLFDPPLVLADEPTGNLDSTAGAGVIELLATSAAGGRTVVMATHDAAAAAAASRVLRLVDGRIDAAPPS